MASRSVFDDLNSFVHMVFGFVAGFATATYAAFIAPVIVTVYIAYETSEHEEEVNRIGDFVEFIVGYILGLSVSIPLFIVYR